MFLGFLPNPELGSCLPSGDSAVEFTLAFLSDHYGLPADHPQVQAVLDSIPALSRRTEWITAISSNPEALHQFARKDLDRLYFDLYSGLYRELLLVLPIYNRAVFQTITDNLQNTISGAIKGMDVDGFVKLYQQESVNNPQCPPAKNAPTAQNGYYPANDPLYMAHENWLYAVEQVSPNTRLYTYVRGSEPGEIIAIGSTGYFRNPRGGFRFCEGYTSKSSEIYNGLSTTCGCMDSIY